MAKAGYKILPISVDIEKDKDIIEFWEDLGRDNAIGRSAYIKALIRAAMIDDEDGDK